MTSRLKEHIIETAEMFLKCSPVFYFYPHFIKRNLGQMTRCHAPVLSTPGDGRKFSPGTGLLNIAGEKIEGSGISGHLSFWPAVGIGLSISIRRPLLCKKFHKHKNLCLTQERKYDNISPVDEQCL